MKAFIFDREGNAIATDCIEDIEDTKRGEVRIYCDTSSIGHYFRAAQDTVEGVVAAIRQAEIGAAGADEYRRCEARQDFEQKRTAQ